MAGNRQFDTIIEKGTLIDPALGRNGRFDVAVTDGKVAAVEPDLSAAQAATRIDAGGQVVIPGK